MKVFSSAFERTSRNSTICAAFIFALGWFLRAGVVWFNPDARHYIHTDTLAYVANAVAMVHDGSMPYVDYPIGLSVLFAPFVALGADTWFLGHFVQPAVGASSGVLAYFLADRMDGRGAAIIAGVGCAIQPSMINSASQVLTEEWAIVLVLLALLLVQRPTLSRHVWGGLSVGMACVVRSPCLAFAAAIPSWWILTEGWKGLKRSVPFALGAVTVILAASLYLSWAQQRLVMLTPQTGEMSIFAPIRGGWISLTPEQRAQRGIYLKFAVRQPMQFLRERVDSFLTFASPWPFGDDRSLQRKIILMMSDGIVLLAALFASYRAMMDVKLRRLFLLPWMALSLCIFYTLFYSLPRYREPALPLLITFAAVVLVPRRIRTEKAGSSRS